MSNNYIEENKEKIRKMPLLFMKGFGPWKLIQSIPVGGPVAVGFADNQLLILSHEVRSLINCKTGEVTVKEDRNEKPEDYNTNELTYTWSKKFKTPIKIAGIHGGGLSTYTYDGWKIRVEAPDWPNYDVILEPSLKDFIRNPNECAKLYHDSNPRAVGFSPSGKTLVIAGDADVDIYKR